MLQQRPMDWLQEKHPQNLCTIGIYAKFYTGSEVLDAWHESLDRR